LDEAGEVVSEDQLATSKAGLSSLLAKMPSSRVALEVGTHSPWVSRHIAVMGHEVIVANPHKVKLLTQSVRKNDRIDARQLARLARVDPQLLSPIRHRGEAELADGLSRALQNVIRPLLKSVEAISEQIAAYDKKIGEIAKRYPEVELLTPVYGVGTLIALTYILTIEDAQRFGHSRDVGPFLGLQPKQRDSGNSQPQLGISKTGDRLLRSLLVQGAHCILRKGAPESDIRAWGLSKIGSGGKNAKRRTVVAVARKLAVLLHTLWANGEVYDPLYNSKAAQAGGAKAAVKTAA
jgi:transposase